MTCSETCHRARSIGPAASLALANDDVALRVHSVFLATLNLEVEGTAWLVALSGPAVAIHPHAVALERPVDFRNWGLTVGDPADLLDGSLRLRGQAGIVVVDMSQAQRPSPRLLPLIVRLGGAHLACVTRLAGFQQETGCDLRIDALGHGERALTALGAGLRSAALVLGSAAQEFAQTPRHAFAAEVSLALLNQAVAALVGLGAGLTPSGDDFLCGFLAAARACDPVLMEDREELIDALNAAVEPNLQRTTQISAGLIRCATQNFWSMPLVDLAEALAVDREPEALRALDEICSLGHSSGSDMATGFLFGLECLALAPWRALSNLCECGGIIQRN
jgi:hypothetical protein